MGQQLAGAGLGPALRWDQRERSGVRGHQRQLGVLHRTEGRVRQTLID